MSKKYRYIAFMNTLEYGPQYSSTLFNTILADYTSIDSSEFRISARFSHMPNILVLDVTEDFINKVSHDTRIVLSPLNKFVIDSTVAEITDSSLPYDYWYYKEVDFSPSDKQNLVVADVYVMGTGINSVRYQNTDETVSCIASNIVGLSGKKNNVTIIDVNCLKMNYNTQDVLDGMNFILEHHITKRFANRSAPSIAIFPELDEVTILAALELSKYGIFCISGAIDKNGFSHSPELLDRIHREILIVNAYDRNNKLTADNHIYNITAPGECIATNYIPYKTTRYDNSKETPFYESQRRYRVLSGIPAALAITGYIVATFLSKRAYSDIRHIHLIMTAINKNAEYVLDFKSSLTTETDSILNGLPGKKIKMVRDAYDISFENENFNSFLWLAGIIKVPVYIAIVWNELQESNLTFTYNGLLLPNGATLHWDGYISANRFNSGAKNLLWLQSQEFVLWLSEIEFLLKHPLKSFPLPQGIYLYERLRVIAQITVYEKENVYRTPEGTHISFNNETYHVVTL